MTIVEKLRESEFFSGFDSLKEWFTIFSKMFIKEVLTRIVIGSNPELLIFFIHKFSTILRSVNFVIFNARQ